MSNLKVENFEDREKDILKYLEKNGDPGRSMGFKCMDEFYTIKDNGCTDWTGHSSSGKTYLALETLMTQAEMYGKRTALFAPDIGNYNEIWSKLMMMHSGKNFNALHGNKATEDDILKCKTWINFHFLILTQIDIKKNVSPLDFWEFICEYKDDAGVIHSGLLDSWKNCSHEFGGREDTYLDKVLAQRNALAEQYNKHFHTIAHPAKTEMEETESDTQGKGKKKYKRRVPTANDIKGGPSWFANGKCIITVDLPDKTKNGLDVYISKAKPEGVGKPGSVINRIFLDQSRHRFYEDYFGQKRFTFTKDSELVAPMNFNDNDPNAQPF